MSTRSRPPAREGNNTKNDRADLDGRLLEYLLRNSIHHKARQSPKTIAAELAVPYSTVTAHLRQLVRVGVLSEGYRVDPYRTRFCHEFRIDLGVDARRMWKQRGITQPESAPTDPPSGKARCSRECFFSRLIQEVQRTEWLAEHLIVVDLVILHGVPRCDVQLTILTDDGIHTAGRFVRDFVAWRPGIRAVALHTVAWRYSFDGYSGCSPDHPIDKGEPTALPGASRRADCIPVVDVLSTAAGALAYGTQPKAAR
ncbi:MAG: winged helix-turn-helix domain-containing protein [Planctomycetota bacterium]|nr:winged helix-turn-helix domain-containing protein [Planctomycetota bacterium]